MQRACSLSDLPEVGALQVFVDGDAIAVVRDGNGDVHAIEDRCTHAEISLSEGEVEGCSIECWLHGSRFDLKTGKPLELPAITPVRVFAVRVDGDDVYVDPSQDINSAT